MKLSTPVLKQMIATWLSDPKLRPELFHCSEPYGGVTVDDKAESFGFEKGLTQEQLEQKIWDMWRDGKRWKRAEKKRLGDDWEQWLAEYDHESRPVDWKRGDPLPLRASFPEDMCGGHDGPLVKKYFNDRALGEKCWYRLFEPDNQLADNYRLEVITTPEDDMVVGWCVTVD